VLRRLSWLHGKYCWLISVGHLNIVDTACDLLQPCQKLHKPRFVLNCHGSSVLIASKLRLFDDAGSVPIMF
jgi:hypothetical protein